MERNLITSVLTTDVTLQGLAPASHLPPSLTLLFLITTIQPSDCFCSSHMPTTGPLYLFFLPQMLIPQFYTQLAFSSFRIQLKCHLIDKPSLTTLSSEASSSIFVSIFVYLFIVDLPK